MCYFIVVSLLFHAHLNEVDWRLVISIITTWKMTFYRNCLAIDIAYMSLLLLISRDIDNILQMSAYFIAIADAMVIT